MPHALITTRELRELENHMEYHSGSQYRAFLHAPSESNYNELKTSATLAHASYAGAGSTFSRIMLLSMADGTPIIYIADYRTADQNTWAKFQSKEITVNLNTRPGAMSALLSREGVSQTSFRLTTADGTYPLAWIRYIRLGLSSTDAIGLLQLGMYEAL